MSSYCEVYFTIHFVNPFRSTRGKTGREKESLWGQLKKGKGKRTKEEGKRKKEKRKKKKKEENDWE
jgi:hypothetical protein